MLITVILLVVSPFLYDLRKPPFVFFPSADPNFVYVYLNLPVGTDQAYTNEVLGKLEKKVDSVLNYDPANGKTNKVVKSVIANVTVGAVDPTTNEIGDFPNKGRITVAFVEFAKRGGESTTKYLQKIKKAVKKIPVLTPPWIKSRAGPTICRNTIVRDITGDNLDSLVSASSRLKHYLDLKQIPGVENLRSDFDVNKPEIVFDLDRERMDN
jgi:multidrug efflux pump subunit AcrB